MKEIKEDSVIVLPNFSVNADNVFEIPFVHTRKIMEKGDVIKLSNNTIGSCVFCDQYNINEELDDRLNHHMNKHNCKIQHMGTETEWTDDHELWYSTAVYLIYGGE